MSNVDKEVSILFAIFNLEALKDDPKFDDFKSNAQDVVQSALTKNKDSTEQLITNLGLSASTVFGYLKNKPIAKNPKSKSGGGGKKWFYIIAAIIIILYLMGS